MTVACFTNTRLLLYEKGPSAKTQLCWNWLSEFVVREHLAGSTGATGSPMISRVIQFLGDGMIYYNQARKIMFIPFPFPHAQLSVFFILVMIFAVPLLMVEYTSALWLGALLTFFTVTCLSGLHEVARELENPFRYVRRVKDCRFSLKIVSQPFSFLLLQKYTQRHSYLYASSHVQ